MLQETGTYAFLEISPSVFWVPKNGPLIQASVGLFLTWMQYSCIILDLLSFNETDTELQGC